MARVELLYKWLAREADAPTDEILAAALANAEPEYVARIAALLLDRRREAAWAGLVANYHRLAPEQQQRMQKRPELTRAGIAAAIKSPLPMARQNALALLGDQPCAQLAYLAAEALRDPSVHVREGAAWALRRAAEFALTANAVQRGEVAAALRQALRTFDLHGRLDVLEGCLWLARDLGEGLWEMLSDPHARCGRVVAQHLGEWDNPRLAGFLLLALARPAWRPPAQAVLDSWSRPAELVALVDNSDLLADPAVQHGLRHLRRPAWFLAADAALEALPAEVRGRLPYWVRYLGFSYEERRRYLERCLARPWPEMQRGAEHVLAAAGDAEADQILVPLARSRGSAGRFARWYLAGRRVLARLGWTQRGEPPTARSAGSPQEVAGWKR